MALTPATSATCRSVGRLGESFSKAERGMDQSEYGYRNISSVFSVRHKGAYSQRKRPRRPFADALDAVQTHPTICARRLNLPYPAMHSTLPACRARRAFTLIELLTVIAIIGILAAIIIPTVGKVRATARNAQCVSRLRDWGGAIHLYANDNKGKYRIANWLSASSNPYQSYFPQGSVVQNVRFFGGCPLLNQVPTDNNMSYGMIWPSKDGVIGTLDGGTDVTLSKARSPSRFLMMADTMIGSSPRVRATEIDEYMGPLLGRPNPGARGGDTVAKRHGETKINGLFGDGSVKSISGTPAGSGDTNSIYEMRTTWFQLY